MTTALQVRHALDALRLLPMSLPDLIALPDHLAAEALNQRLALLDMVDQAHGISYSQRLVIIAEFRRRQLWKHLIDPVVGEPFPHETAWLSSGFIGCRRTNFEAKRDVEKLSDVPAEKLIDVPKGNIKVLTQLSTAVRNQPDVLEAARTLPPEEFEEKVEADHPHQHLEARKAMPLRLGRSQRRVVDQWVEYALEHDLADNREDAIVKACEAALHDAELDEELKSMPKGGGQ